MKTSPITPQECHEKCTSGENIPVCVFKVINELIEKNYYSSTKRAKVFIDDIFAILKKDYGLSSKDITKNKWLDVEPIYRKNGWKVEFVQPGWSVPDPDYFIFSWKGKNNQNITEGVQLANTKTVASSTKPTRPPKGPRKK